MALSQVSECIKETIKKIYYYMYLIHMHSHHAQSVVILSACTSVDLADAIASKENIQILA